MVSKAFADFENQLRKPEISMAPLIDMVFLLLIFFTVTTTFTKETGIKVEKAKAATSQSIHKNLLIIDIDKQGNYWYDGRSRPLQEMVAIALEKNEKTDDLNIVLVPDKKSETEALITIMDHLRMNDVSRFSLGTQLVDRSEIPSR